jgi:hypothetical protein
MVVVLRKQLLWPNRLMMVVLRKQLLWPNKFDDDGIT